MTQRYHYGIICARSKCKQNFVDIILFFVEISLFESISLDEIIKIVSFIIDRRHSDGV